jgi:hypothetical protein
MIDIRFLQPEDYDNILVGWWKGWRWTPPAKDMLPQDGAGGLIVSIDKVDVCAGFIYFTNSKTVWIEYIVSNPEFKDRDSRVIALDTLIYTLTDIAKDKGYKFAYTSLKSNPLIERYEACGYQLGSSGCQEMIKLL